MTGFETHLGNVEYPVTKEIHLGIHYPISLQWISHLFLVYHTFISIHP